MRDRLRPAADHLRLDIVRIGIGRLNEIVHIGIAAEDLEIGGHLGEGRRRLSPFRSITTWTLTRCTRLLLTPHAIALAIAPVILPEPTISIASRKLSWMAERSKLPGYRHKRGPEVALWPSFKFACYSAKRSSQVQQ
jgi:hypothetical protein